MSDQLVAKASNALMVVQDFYASALQQSAAEKQQLADALKQQALAQRAGVDTRASNRLHVVLTWVQENLTEAQLSTVLKLVEDTD